MTPLHSACVRCSVDCGVRALQAFKLDEVVSRSTVSFLLVVCKVPTAVPSDDSMTDYTFVSQRLHCMMCTKCPLRRCCMMR
jgi:hypothetical protein